MKSAIYISIFLILCFGHVSLIAQDDNASEIDSRMYENSEGSIELIETGKGQFFVIFTNNEGFQYDTTLKMTKVDARQRMYPWGNSGNLLEYSFGGLMVEENRIEIFEFSGMGVLIEETKMNGIYDKPFYLTGEETTVTNDINTAKDGHHIDGIFLGRQNLPGSNNETYFEVEGVIKKEAYPLSYYSTDESPQGMFDGDTTKKHYRLVFSEPTIKLPKTYLYRGTALNDSEGRACIAWEYADSEIYGIWGKEEPWAKEEEGKFLEAHAVYAHENGYSWLKNVIYLH